MNKPRPIKKIGRKRRTLGWMLLALGLFVAGVWVASGWWIAVCERGSTGVKIARGEVITITRTNGVAAPHIEVSRHHQALVRWYGWGSREHEHGTVRNLGVICLEEFDLMGPAHLVGVLFWPIPLLLWTPAALLLRSGILARRRAMTNACPKCGYSLAGLAADAPCPECGKGAVIA